jgi:hypothetical protein
VSVDLKYRRPKKRTPICDCKISKKVHLQHIISFFHDDYADIMSQLASVAFGVFGRLGNVVGISNLGSTCQVNPEL